MLAESTLSPRARLIASLVLALSGTYLLSFGLFRYDGLLGITGLACMALPQQGKGLLSTAKRISRMLLIAGALIAAIIAVAIGAVWMFGNGAYP